MEDIWRRVESYGECPAVLTEAEAVQDLAQRSYLYSQEASPLVATDLDKIKIPTSASGPEGRPRPCPT